MPPRRSGVYHSTALASAVGLQFGLALASAVLLFVVWEIAKLIGRRTTLDARAATATAPS